MALAPTTRRAIANAYERGHPVKLIAHEFGISQSYVAHVAKGVGAEPRTSGRQLSPRPIDDAQVLALFCSGLDTTAIALWLKIKQADAANALARIRDGGRS